MDGPQIRDAIRAALKFFGPLTVAEIVSKLNLRGIDCHPDTIRGECRYLVARKWIDRASGYNEEAFRIREGT